MSHPLPPSILSHVSVGTNDFERARAFYDAALAPLQIRTVMSFDGAVAYGREWPEFWVQRPFDAGRATVANGVHFAFLAPDEAAVHAFHAAALAAGGTDEGAPGPRPDYGPDYYAAFVRDPDGHKIEAMVFTGPSGA
jgi:catechol 2,3-dioxygenase-like lactoylglutathione lyase family enzyme